MRVAVACDHAGFPAKEAVLATVRSAGHEALDLGTPGPEPPVDYPDQARLVADAIRAGRAERGIVLCGSGVGAAIAANKIPGIRAGVCHDTYSAHQAVEHDDMNILALGARVIGPELVAAVVREFVGARFMASVPRYVRRLDKVNALEREARGK